MAGEDVTVDMEANMLTNHTTGKQYQLKPLGDVSAAAVWWCVVALADVWWCVVVASDRQPVDCLQSFPRPRRTHAA